MASEKYLAIDIGASSGRAIVGTLEDGKITLEEMHRFEIYKTSRADLDNLEKAVMDALTAAKWWQDDCLVVDKRTVKVWGACDGCEILAEELKNIKTFGEGWI